MWKKGNKHTAETKRKMSENHADVSGKNHPMYGKKHSAMSRKKMSDAQIGKKHKDVTKKKISDATSGENNHMYGKNHTAATIKKQSEVKIGKYEGENNSFYKHGLSKTKEYIRATSSKRRAAKKNQTPELTEIEQNKIYFIYELAATMADVHVDHYQPLSKGGLHHPDNLQILDAKLNLEKNDKWPLTEIEQVKYKGYKVGGI